MNQVPVKWVHPTAFLNKKQADLMSVHHIPVVPLEALREVVEGLKVMSRPMAECPPELYQEWLDSNGEQTFWGWLAQRLLAGLGVDK